MSMLDVAKRSSNEELMHACMNYAAKHLSKVSKRQSTLTAWQTTPTSP